MQPKTIATFECTLVQKEFLLVGQSITANFPDAFPEAAIKVQKEFLQRADEIPYAKNKEILFSPYMCNEIIATYFACLEVDEIGQVPDGMVGFQLPMTRYAKISCSNKTISEGYDTVFAWMKKHGYRQKWFDHSSPVEVYYLDENAEEEAAEIFIPIY